MFLEIEGAYPIYVNEVCYNVYKVLYTVCDKASGNLQRLGSSS